MQEGAHHPDPERAHRLGALLSAGLPLLLCIATASAYPAGEPGAIATALSLDWQQALWAAWARAFSLLPLGSLSLRVALASAVALSLAAAAFYRTLARVLERFLQPADGAASSAALMALGVSWALSGAPPLAQLGATAQPGALVVMLAALSLEGWSSYYLAQPGRGALSRSLLWAALCALALPWLGILLLIPAVASPLAARIAVPMDAPRTPTRGRPLRFVTVLAALALGLVTLRHSALARLSTAYVAADELQEQLRATLPTRALLLLQPETARRLQDAEHEQRARPDVRWLSLHDFEHTEGAARLSAQPELRPLLRQWLLQGELPVAGLQSFATQRPLLLELEAERIGSARPELLETLVPQGLLLRASSSALIGSDLALAAKQQGRLRSTESAIVADAPAPLQRWLEARAQAEIVYYERAAGEQAPELIALAGLGEPAVSTP